MQDPLSLLAQADESDLPLNSPNDGGDTNQDQGVQSSSLLFSPSLPSSCHHHHHHHNDDDNGGGHSGASSTTTIQTQARHGGATMLTPNSTLAFFDKFVSEARAASESKRRSVLDEILLHQDDRLFQWSVGGGDDGAGRGSAADIDGDKNTPGGDDDNDQHQIPYLQDALNSPIPTLPKRRKRQHTSGPSSPRHSPTLPTLPTLAPLLESTHTVSISVPSPSPAVPIINMPFISHSAHTQPISIPTAAAGDTHDGATSIDTTATASSSSFRRGKTRHHARSAIMASITHSSPFASHMFLPISGAPGFTEERYDWDKGYSDGLLRELEDVNANGPLRGTPPRSGSPSVVSVNFKGRKDATTVPVLDVDLADLVCSPSFFSSCIHAKFVQLRAQLPALDRLPKTWHLVYSLDQHGISLQTLYTRCEAHSQAQAQARLVGTGTTRTGGTGEMVSIGRPGMMVVVKDSGDSVFGVWMGEGIRQSRGKGYYGSGER